MSDPSHRIQIYRRLCAAIRIFRIREILWTIGIAFHRNEVFPADDAKDFSQKGHVNAPRKSLWIEAAETSEQINLIPVRVVQHEHHWNGIIGIAVAQGDVKARALE